MKIKLKDNILNGLLVMKKSSKNTKKYIKELCNKIKYSFSLMKNYLHKTRNWLKEEEVCSKIGYDVITILINGFVIWIMLIPFVNTNPIWYIPSYGILPWFVVNFVRELKE